MTKPDRGCDPEVPLPVQECICYLPGHQTHWIPVTSVHAQTPRDPITVTSADDRGWVRIRDGEGKDCRWWHHDPARLVALWRSGAPWSRVRGTSFLIAALPGGNDAWVYCADDSTPCVRREEISDPIAAIRTTGGFTLDSSEVRRLLEQLSDEEN